MKEKKVRSSSSHEKRQLNNTDNCRQTERQKKRRIDGRHTEKEK